MSRRRWVRLGRAWLASAAVFAACGSPLDEIRDALPESQRSLFDAGAAAAAPCWSCHDFLRPIHKTGPHLVGVMGRRAGSVPGFGYSDALRASGLRWSERSLRAFLADPQGSVPGNYMVAPGVRDSESLHALVFFIEHATRPPAETP